MKKSIQDESEQFKVYGRIRPLLKREINSDNFYNNETKNKTCLINNTNTVIE